MAKQKPTPKPIITEGRIRASWNPKTHMPEVTGCGAGMANWLNNELHTLCAMLQTTHKYDPKTLKFQMDMLPPPEEKVAPPPMKPFDADDEVVI